MPRQIKIGSNKVQVLPSGAYSVRIPCGKKDGKYIKKRITAPTLSQLRDMVDQFAEGNDVSSSETVGSALRQYIETCRIAGHSPATIRGYITLSNNAYGSISDINLRQITPIMIQQWVNQYAQDHAPKGVKNAYGLLHKVIVLYRDDINLKHIMLPKLKNGVNGDAGVVIPDSDMIMALMEYTKETDIQLYKAVLLCSMAGLRRSQLCGLVWDDVKEGHIDINKALVVGENGTALKGPKSASGRRSVSIPKAVQAELEKLRKGPSEPIVNITPTTLSIRWCRVRDKLGIPGRLHDLRHYHASVLVALGVPPEYIMRDMGHSTTEMYRRVYTHMMPEKQREIDKAVDAYTDKLFNKKTGHK